ncbi:MAG: peptidoglycan-binding domain-containing protein [Paracoccaceae bacterium]
MLLSLKSTAIAAATALSIAAIPAAPAHAWGKKEQGFVAGVATAVIIDELIDGRKYRRAAPAPAPRPIYVEPRASYGSIYHTPAAQAFNSYSKGERRAIQRSLRAQGYYRGGLDGSFGPGTYNAVVAYARDARASGHLNSAGGAYAIYDGLIY